MKKVFAFLLSAALVMTSFVQVFAEESNDSGLEKAINKVKSVIDIPEEFSKFDYSIGGNKGEKIWRLTWKTDNDSKVDSNISISVDETGYIRDYSKYSSNGDNYSTSKLPKYSRQSARDAAKAFLEKIQPGITSKIEEDADNFKYIGSKDYYFNFHYVEDGIPYNGFNCSVTVKGDTCEVRNYYCSKTLSVTFPTKNGILQDKDIQQLILNAGGVELKYLQTFEDGNIKVYPVYSLTKAGKVQYDAHTGLALDENVDFYFKDNFGIGGGEMDMTTAAESNVKYNLTKQELDAVKDISDVITKEDADKKIRAIPEIGLDDNYTASYFHLYKSNKNDGQYLWNISYNRDLEKAESNAAIDRNYINVVIDAETGSLISFSSGYYASRTGESKIDYTSAKNAAEKFIKKFESDKFSQTAFCADRSSVDKATAKTIIPVNTYDYSFTYRRMVNGIPCESDCIFVGVDGKTGNILNYTVDWYNGQFPDLQKDKIISKDQAYNYFFDQVGLKLYYVNSAVNNDVDPKSDKQTNTEVKLVYAFDKTKPQIIDAQTGGILDNQGKPYEENKIKPYTDIAGHFSEQAVKILQEYGVGFDSEKFMPDQQITQKELLELIMKSYDSYFTHYVKADQREKYIYDNLMRRGVIRQEEINPTALVSREDSVKFIIRYMGLQRAADIQGIYVCDFDDKDSISQDVLGYVCIAKGLNLINGYNNNFSPKETMTRGEAAVLLYNSLK